jgi:hypothetical protein
MSWEEVRSPDPNESGLVEFAMDESVHVGLAVSSHNAGRAAEARIGHVTSTGDMNPAGPFTISEDIGLQTIWPSPEGGSQMTSVDANGLSTQSPSEVKRLRFTDGELSEHRRLIDENCKQLHRLEVIVGAEKVEPLPRQATAAIYPVESISQSTMHMAANVQSAQKLDINRLSEQEKNILAVFFQNQGMALSYVDIGRALNKPPNTLKNQIRQIRPKADLFDRMVDTCGTNRFKLKDGLRIEKYLNVA